MNANLAVGQSSEITLEVENLGSMALEDLTAEINYYGSSIIFSDDLFSFNNINSGQSAS